MPAAKAISRRRYESCLHSKAARKRSKPRHKRGAWQVSYGNESGIQSQEFGHGKQIKRAREKVCLTTLAERKTRNCVAIKLPDRRAETVEKAFAFSKEAVKSIACGRGTALADWPNIEEGWNCDKKFADSY